MEVKDWEALTEVEREARADKKPEELAQDSEPVVTEGKPDDRPEKNYKMELNRKTQKIAELKQELEETRKNQQIKSNRELDEELSDLGYSEDEKKSLRKVVDSRVKEAEEKIASLERQVYTSARETNLESAIKSDTTGIAKKYREEIEEVLDEIDPSVWGSKKAVKRMVDMVIGNHINEIAGKKTNLLPSPTETIGGGGKGSGGSVTNNEMQEIANEMRIDITPANKEKIKKLIIARKKVTEKQEE